MNYTFFIWGSAVHSNGAQFTMKNLRPGFISLVTRATRDYVQSD